MKETIEREREKDVSSFEWRKHGWRYFTRRLRMRVKGKTEEACQRESLRVTFIQIKRVFF